MWCEKELSRHAVYDWDTQSGRPLSRNQGGRLMPCGCTGCGDDVVARIDHPNGIRAVCNEHVDDYTVVEEVA